MNKLKLFGIISLALFVGSVTYQVLASYLTSPTGLKYPEPGHYPEQIGPGTFNCSGNANCYWEFPNAMYIDSSSGKVGIGTKTPTEKLEVVGNIKASKIIDRDNTNYYIDPSSTSKVVRIEATDYIKAPKICIGNDCRVEWPKEEISDGQFLRELYYRRSIFIKNRSGKTLKNSLVLITIDTKSLISQGKMRSDCKNIKFTWYNAAEGIEVPIPYWIVGCGSTNTIILVRVPEIPANGEATVYMYYSHSIFNDEGLLPEVIFYDDFDDGDIRDWKVKKWGRDSGDVKVDNGRLRLRVYKCYNIEVSHFIGDFSSNPTCLLIMFDWQTKADWWYEIPGWKILVNGKKVRYTIIAGTNIKSPGCCGNKKGYTIAKACVNGRTEIVFRIYQSWACWIWDHKNTYLWIDNLKVFKLGDGTVAATVGPEEKIVIYQKFKKLK